MQVYQVSPTLLKSVIVKELNAVVLRNTFPYEHGIFEADLYTSNNECNMLVYKNHCAPVNALFVKTVTIRL